MGSVVKVRVPTCFAKEKVDEAVPCLGLRVVVLDRDRRIPLLRCSDLSLEPLDLGIVVFLRPELRLQLRVFLLQLRFELFQLSRVSFPAASAWVAKVSSNLRPLRIFGLKRV